MNKVLSITLIILCIIAFAYLCMLIGFTRGQKIIENQIKEQIHAPGPITIGDTIYIVRYYPL
jgi:hypothetical protein